jgi:hypothetical protein
MKKKIITSILSVALIVSLGINVFAYTVTYGPTSSWNYSNYSHGSYVPKTGSMSTTFYDFDPSTGLDDANTYVSFTLDSSNVSSILDFNNGGDNPGTEADNKTCYLSIDVRSKRTGSDDMMSAYSVTSSLPNPKTDIENDDIFGNRNEESEVVALGTVQAQGYYMSTMWDDYRSGGSTDNGRWDCQFGVSGQYLKVGGVWIPSSGDYNAIMISDVNQASVSYGNNSGRP